MDETSRSDVLSEMPKGSISDDIEPPKNYAKRLRRRAIKKLCSAVYGGVIDRFSCYYFPPSVIDIWRLIIHTPRPNDLEIGQLRFNDNIKYLGYGGPLISPIEIIQFIVIFDLVHPQFSVIHVYYFGKRLVKIIIEHEDIDRCEDPESFIVSSVNSPIKKYRVAEVPPLIMNYIKISRGYRIHIVIYDIHADFD